MKKIIDILQESYPDVADEFETSDDFISDGLIDSVDLQELFAMIEKEYDIEYYPHSGLIKAVDGCSPYDGEGLQTMYDEWKAAVEEKKEDENK